MTLLHPLPTKEDGYFDVDYEDEAFSTFEVREGGRWDRGRAEISRYIWLDPGGGFGERVKPDT